MKLKASVLGLSLGSWLFGGRGRVLVTHLLRCYFSFFQAAQWGRGLEVGVSCGPATALNLGRAFPSWTFDFPFWVGNHLL